MSRFRAPVETSSLPILVVSTQTRDHLPADLDGQAKTIAGGPAHYMALAFDTLRAPYRVLTNQSVDVEVVHTPGGEAYIIPAIETIPLPPRLEGSAVILSPIIREIDPECLPPVDGLLVIDVQGFVREPGIRSDLAVGPYHLAPLLRRAHLVKAAEEEVSLLDAASRDALRGTTALITGGPRGARLEGPHGTVTIHANPVDTPDTIGAGDNFLAAMTWGLVQGRSMEAAAADAARFTEDVLRWRTRGEGES